MNRPNHCAKHPLGAKALGRIFGASARRYSIWPYIDSAMALRQDPLGGGLALRAVPYKF